MKKLWVFGDSFSRAYNVGIGWPDIIAKTYGLELVNFAQPAVDNFFIYQSCVKALPNIDFKDFVVLQWSHPNRKTWIYNDINHRHYEVIKKSLVYNSREHVFFRYDGSGRQKTLLYTPVNSGIDFYDKWFCDYFNEYEQRLTLQAFYGDIKLKLPNHVVCFFSKESVEQTDITEHLFVLDFILENHLFINKTDLHFNEEGHKQWAEKISKELQLM